MNTAQPLNQGYKVIFHFFNRLSFIFVFFVSCVLTQSLGALTFEHQLNTFVDNNNIRLNNTNLMISTLTFGQEGKLIKLETISNLTVMDLLGSDWSNENISLTPYRFVYSYEHQLTEIRAGLQQLSFGTARYLRPLQWFDSINALDADALNDGVYSLLYRRYSLSNQVVWFWTLYGNNALRVSDINSTVENGVELGARIQHPISIGEIGLSVHSRPITMSSSQAQEYKFGLDFVTNGLIPFWTEHMFLTAKSNSEEQQIVKSMIGSDFTFPIGNGIYVLSEIQYSNMLLNNDQEDFLTTFFQVSYPISIMDQISFSSILSQGNRSDIVMLARSYDFFKVIAIMYTKEKQASLALYWNY